MAKPERASADKTNQFIPVPVADLPAMADRLGAFLLADDGKQGDFTFESVDVESAAFSAHVVLLALYQGRKDPDVDENDEDQEFGSEPYTPAFARATERMSQARDALIAAWGEPVHWRAGEDAPDGVPGRDLRFATLQYKQQAAEIWIRSGSAFALSNGWQGLPETGHWAQLLFVMPADVVTTPQTPEFVFSTSAGVQQTVSGDDLDQLAEAFQAFFEDHRDTDLISIENVPAQTRLDLDTAQRYASRTGNQTQFTPLVSVDRAATLGKWFILFGNDRLAAAGPWSDTPPSAPAYPAAEELEVTATSDDAQSEALARLGASWDEAGADDPTGEFCVLLESSGWEEQQDARRQILQDLRTLGLTQAEPQQPGRDGEVWVRYDDRLRAEIERWI